jgi:hypothetical protein
MAVSAMHIAQSSGLSRFKALQTASRTPMGSQPLGCECQQKTQKVGGTNWVIASLSHANLHRPLAWPSRPCTSPSPWDYRGSKRYKPHHEAQWDRSLWDANASKRRKRWVAPIAKGGWHQLGWSASKRSCGADGYLRARSPGHNASIQGAVRLLAKPGNPTPTRSNPLL